MTFFHRPYKNTYLLFKRPFQQPNIVNPYGALAINNQIEFYIVRILPLFQHERCIFRYPVRAADQRPVKPGLAAPVVNSHTGPLYIVPGIDGITIRPWYSSIRQ